MRGRETCRDVWVRVLQKFIMFFVWKYKPRALRANARQRQIKIWRRAWTRLDLRIGPVGPFVMVCDNSGMFTSANHSKADWHSFSDSAIFFTFLSSYLQPILLRLNDIAINWRLAVQPNNLKLMGDAEPPTFRIAAVTLGISTLPSLGAG